MAFPAAAQTFGVGVTSSTPDLGDVASAASGTTTFRISPSTGTISKLSGSGGRVSTGTSRATVTVTCGNQNACNTDSVNVKIGSGSSTGRAGQMTNFTVAMGTASQTVATSGTNPITFRIGPIGKNASKTFYVGGDVPIVGDGATATGAAMASFYVWIAESPTTPTGAISDSGEAVANVFRSISLAKNSDLAFGRIVRPLSGVGGTIALAASNAAKTYPAGVAWMNLPVASRASYTVTGEGGQTMAITIPSSFTMTNADGSSLTVTTNNNLGVTPTLSSILGNSGTYSFFVGGSFPISPTTDSGAYSGAFTVTVAYN